MKVSGGLFNYYWLTDYARKEARFHQTYKSPGVYSNSEYRYTLGHLTDETIGLMLNSSSIGSGKKKITSSKYATIDCTNLNKNLWEGQKLNIDFCQDKTGTRIYPNQSHQGYKNLKYTIESQVIDPSDDITLCSNGSKCKKLGSKPLGSEADYQCMDCAELTEGQVRDMVIDRFKKQASRILGPSTDSIWEYFLINAPLNRECSSKSCCRETLKIGVTSMTYSACKDHEYEVLRQKLVDEVSQFVSSDSGIQADLKKLEYQYAVLVGFVKVAFPETIEKNAALKSLLEGNDHLFSGSELLGLLAKKERFNLIFMEKTKPNHPNFEMSGYRNDVARALLAKNHKYIYSPF